VRFTNLVSTLSHGYESFEGEMDGYPFAIGRNLTAGHEFQEDLRGNLTTEQVSDIFLEIDNLRKQKKLL
jgi:hypothetical protein